MTFEVNSNSEKQPTIPPVPMVKRVGRNTAGRDFVIGDIHGSFDLVRQAMAGANFNPAVDRLFSVGDLVDRGPQSVEALEFLQQDFVHAVRGNHEQMFLEMYERLPIGAALNEGELFIKTMKNGMSWWRDISEDTRQKMLTAFSQLPIALDVESDYGLYGIVHADVPSGMHWQVFRNHLLESDERVIYTALWSRSRIRHRIADRIDSIVGIYVGHIPLERSDMLGNIRYIDTGAVFGMLKNDNKVGRNTMVQMTLPYTDFMAAPADHVIDVRMNRQQKSPPQIVKAVLDKKRPATR